MRRDHSYHSHSPRHSHSSWHSGFSSSSRSSRHSHSSGHSSHHSDCSHSHHSHSSARSYSSFSHSDTSLSLSCDFKLRPHARSFTSGDSDSCHRCGGLGDGIGDDHSHGSGFGSDTDSVSSLSSVFLGNNQALTSNLNLQRSQALQFTTTPDTRVT